MEVLLTKSQNVGMMGLGSVTFTLNTQVRLTDDEAALVKRYQLGSLIIFDQYPHITAWADKFRFVGTAWAILSRMLKLRFTIGSLISGRTVQAKDVVEVLAVRSELTGAAQKFHNLLMASKYFEGEELITYKDE
jgi:hypothetical protein